MNILYINDFAPSFPGSFFESLDALSSRLKKDNHNLYYIFPLEREYIKRLDELGVVYYCPTFMGKKFDINLFKLTYRVCKKENIDIIHTNFGFGGFFAATILSGILKIKHIAHERSLSSNLDSGYNIRIKRFRAKVLFGVLNFLGDTSYIAISNEIKENLINQIEIDKNKIIIIPNAVISNRQNGEKKNLEYSTVKKIALTKKIIGMVAHFGPHKDHKILVDVAAMVIKKPRMSYFY
ncbi:MAG: glycosyltransferase [Ignavibacteriales bacterium]|nr:glycosyltransferase [Ignavibacteriales bacterium]